jgi:hypothetical protein
MTSDYRWSCCKTGRDSQSFIMDLKQTGRLPPGVTSQQSCCVFTSLRPNLEVGRQWIPPPTQHNSYVERLLHIIVSCLLKVMLALSPLPPTQSVVTLGVAEASRRCGASERIHCFGIAFFFLDSSILMYSKAAVFNCFLFAYPQMYLLLVYNTSYSL